MRKSLRRRAGRERGAAALEFALIAPIVFSVLFGTITYGLWFNDSLNLRQGLRESARQGVVARYGATESCDMTYSATPSSNMKKLMCKAQDQVGAMTGETYVKVALPGGWTRGQQLLICGMVEAERLPGLVPLPEDRIIRWSTRMSIEKVAPSQTETGGEETAPAGSSWSWCT